MPPDENQKKRCWCHPSCGKIRSRTARRQHYKLIVKAGEEDGIQPSDSLDSADEGYVMPDSDSSVPEYADPGVSSGHYGMIYISYHVTSNLQ